MKRLVCLLAALTLTACGAGDPAGPSAEPAGGQVEVLWLGQAAFRITTATGKVIVIDPWLTTNPKTPEQYKDLNALGKVDVILVTHGHFDHVTDAPALAKMHNAPLFAPYGLNETLVKIGEVPAELAPGVGKSGIVTPLGPDIKINMVRAEHSSEYAWKDPANGKEVSLPGGEPVGWIIELENGFSIYHTGDTGLFGDMELIGETYDPDLLLIPIGGNFTVNPEQAARATTEFIKPDFAIPMHYGTFPILAGKPEDYAQAVGDKAKVLVPQPGEALKF